jgi:hypothetical protein
MVDPPLLDVPPTRPPEAIHQVVEHHPHLEESLLLVDHGLSLQSVLPPSLAASVAAAFTDAAEDWVEAVALVVPAIRWASGLDMSVTVGISWTREGEREIRGKRTEDRGKIGLLGVFQVGLYRPIPRMDCAAPGSASSRAEGVCNLR